MVDRVTFSNQGRRLKRPVDRLLDDPNDTQRKRRARRVVVTQANLDIVRSTSQALAISSAQLPSTPRRTPTLTPTPPQSPSPLPSPSPSALPSPSLSPLALTSPAASPNAVVERTAKRTTLAEETASWLRQQLLRREKSKKGRAATSADQEKMIRNAYAVGCPVAVVEWKRLLTEYRNKRAEEDITTTSAAKGGLLAQVPSSAKTDCLQTRKALNANGQAQTDLSRLVATCVDAFRATEKDKSTELAVAVRRRFNLAKLWEAYSALERMYADDQTPAWRWQQPTRWECFQTRAKVHLFLAMHPKLSCGDSPQSKPSARDLREAGGETRRDWDALRSSLCAAGHWFIIAQRLGYGALLLIPSTMIRRTFLESRLRCDQLEVWADLVLHVRP